MIVRDILDPNAPVAAPDETAAGAWERMRSLRVDHLVVVRSGRVVGILSGHDLAGPSGGAHRRMGRTVADLMRRDVVTTSPSAAVRHVAALMRHHGIGCVPVLERDRLVGVVTVSRLLELLEHRLAEVSDRGRPRRRSRSAAARTPAD